ncbi:MAG: hypothetical protein ACREV8_03695 [Gammaproteobacteria bacterium]
MDVVHRAPNDAAGYKPRDVWASAATALSVSDRIGQPMKTFMVECYWPGTIEPKAPESLNRVVRLVGEAVPGDSVRFLGCILVPADGMALFLFRASSEDVVERIGRLSELPFDRIVNSVHIGFDQEPTCETAGM